MTKPYQPNHIPAGKRLRLAIYSIALLLYGGHGLWRNDLYLPWPRHHGTHLHDVSAWTMFGAFVCGSLVMVSIVVDHYDGRDNEKTYQKFSDVCKDIGACLVALSIALRIASAIQPA